MHGLNRRGEVVDDDADREYERRAEADDEALRNFQRVGVGGRHELHLESQRRPRWDWASFVHPVGVLWRDHEHCTLADRHRADAQVPAEDDLRGTQHKFDRLPALFAAVKHAAVLERASVVDGDGLAGHRHAALAPLLNLLRQAGPEFDDRHGKKGVKFARRQTRQLGL